MPNHCRDLEENPARSSRRKLSDSAMEAAAAPTNKQARTAAWAASQHAATSSLSSSLLPPPQRPPSPQPPAHPGAGEPRFDSGSDAAGRGFDEEYEVSSVLSDEYYLHDGMNDGDDDEESPCETEFVGADAGGLGSAVLRAHTAFPSGSWRCSECLIVNLLSHRYCLYCWSPRRDSQRDSGIYPGSDSDEEDEEEVAAVSLADAEVGAQEEDVEVVDEEEDEEGDGEGNGEDATAVGHGGGGVKMAARVAKMAAAAAAKRHGKQQQQEAVSAVTAATEERAVAGLTETCVICRVRRRDATIVHGGTGHLVSCFACAQRLHGQRRPCPVCRGPIQLVIRTFVS